MPAWVLALVSSLHVALALLRQHRSLPGVRRVAMLAVSYAFAASPWVNAELGPLLLGVAAHVAWFALTDRWAAGDLGRHVPGPTRTAGAAAAETGPTAARSGTGFTPLTVLAAFDETPEIRTFRLARPKGWKFEAGQFLPVRVLLDGADHVRCYSISSAPGMAGCLEISVRRQGLVSNALHATLARGSTLPARRPAGRFVYPSDDDRPLVLLAGGVGITPLMSMLRHAVAADPLRPVTLIHSARTVEGLAYADELRVLERRHPQFRWVPAISGGSVGHGYHPGRIDATLLGAAAPGLQHSITLVCGPDEMIRSMRGLLSSLGVPESQVRFEAFEAATAAAGAQAADTGPRAAVGQVTVSFVRSQVEQRVSSSATLLDAADACGVTIPSLCRAGVCGTCRTRVLEGDVHCPSDALDADDQASGYVLACVSWMQGHCSVEA